MQDEREPEIPVVEHRVRRLEQETRITPLAPNEVC